MFVVCCKVACFVGHIIILLIPYLILLSLHSRPYTTMKFSAILIASLAASTQAFAPSRPVVSIKTLAAATLEAPTESASSSEDVPPPVVVAESVSTEMAVEKDWPVDQENFVKDSDRIEP